MTMFSFFSRLRHSPIPRRAVIALVMLAVLAWGSPAFCGEIHDATRRGNLEEVKALLTLHPELVFSMDMVGNTPLHLAALYGREKIAELLLANKADVNARASSGRTPLHMAALVGHKDLVELLLANNAEVNAFARNGDTPLHLAAAWGHKADVVELLLAHGADVNARDLGGYTPSQAAAKRGYKDMEELLRQHAAQEPPATKQPVTLSAQTRGTEIPKGNGEATADPGAAAPGSATLKPKGLHVWVDGQDTQSCKVHKALNGKRYQTCRQPGSIQLTPGEHELAFEPIGYASEGKDVQALTVEAGKTYTAKLRTQYEETIAVQRVYRGTVVTTQNRWWVEITPK